METQFDAGRPGQIQDAGAFPVNVCPVIRVGPRGGRQFRMARESNHLSNDFDTENTGGLLSGFLAEEDSFDRRALWRLGSWGAATVAAVTLAVFANQSSLGWRRDQVAAADLARQAQQVQAVASESHSEARRLASAIETLNGDRDRLYSRVTVLEQGLDSVAGAVARQTAAPAWPQQAPPFSAAAEPPMAANPPPAVSPVATAAAAIVEKSQPAAAEPAPATVASVDQVASNSPAATPLMPARSMLAPPDAPASKLIEPDASRKNITASPMPDVTASVDPEPEAIEALPKLSLRRTEFGVDLGSANTVSGLRMLWRGLLKSRANAQLAELQPIIMVREGSGGQGLQLRLGAGPLSDAAAAAKICAVLVESQRVCETTVFDGQRLALQRDEPAAAKPAPRKRAPAQKPVTSDEPARKPEASTLSSLWKRSP